MSNNNIQDTVMNICTSLFTDAKSAELYAQNPQQYLADQLGDADLAEVDLPAAINDAAAKADVAPDMGEALNTAIYQPAHTIRVPEPKIDRYDDVRLDPKDVKETKEYDEQRHDGQEYDGVKIADDVRMPDHVRIPEAEERYPDLETPKYDGNARPENDHNEYDGYERMDDGGYRVATPDDYDHEAYIPERYTPEEPCTIDCVEYSVSNCVTTMYADTPEIADTLCETRTYDDPYVRPEPTPEYDQYEAARQDDRRDERDETHDMDERHDADWTPEYDGDDMPKYDEETPKYEDTPKYDEETPKYEDTPKYDEETPKYEDTPKYDEETPKYDEAPAAVHNDMPADDCDEAWGNGDEAPMAETYDTGADRDDDWGDGAAAEPVATPVHEEQVPVYEQAPVMEEAPAYEAPVEEYVAPVEEVYEAPVVDVYETPDVADMAPMADEMMAE